MSPPPEVARRNGMKGGRPTGPTTKISRARAIALVEQGNSPLDVMIDNMHFWHYRTRDLEDGIKKLLVEIKHPMQNSTSDDVKLYLKQRQRALEMYEMFVTARHESQKCAGDAAPYCHPKLASIEMPARERPDPREIHAGMSVEESAAIWAETLKQVA